MRRYFGGQFGPVPGIAPEIDAMLQKAKDSVVEFGCVSAVIQANPSGMGLIFTAIVIVCQNINLFYLG